ncbi:MAG: hypothetical protein ABWZ26_07705 [Candidatus Nanopelagicales bacterium]
MPSTEAATAATPVKGSPQLPTRGRGWLWELLPPVALLTLGSLLLVRGHALWYDELFTAEVARLPLGDIVRSIIDGEGITPYLEGVPPSYNGPYYLVMHAWMALPGIGSDTSLRILTLLAAAAGLAVLVRAVTRLAGRPAGVVAGLAIAANPLLVPQAVQARSYGLALLATAVAFLGLVRWLQDSPRGLLLFGIGGAAMGLAHWYTAGVLIGFVVAAWVVRRDALPVAVVGALAVLPTVALVVLNLLNGNADRNAFQDTTNGALSWYAAQAWAGQQTVLLAVTLALTAAALVRAPRIGVIGACWLGVPLVLLTAVETLVRPVYTPRYLLTALLALGVLAGVGATVWSRRSLVVALSALLVGCSLVATIPLLDRPGRERGDEVVEMLAAAHRLGEPIVAGDRRSAIALDHYIRLLAPDLRPDLSLPPDDAPAGPDRVWLVRREVDGGLTKTDDETLLRAEGLALAGETRFSASSTTLVVQRWDRAVQDR